MFDKQGMFLEDKTGFFLCQVGTGKEGLICLRRRKGEYKVLFYASGW